MKGYTMNDYEDDLSIAMREIEETKEAMIKTEITLEFLLELERVRLDLGVSPYVSFTDDMIKWVMIAMNRVNKAKEKHNDTATKSSKKLA